MRRRDIGYRITKFKGKAVAVAIYAMFGTMAAGGAVANVPTPVSTPSATGATYDSNFSILTIGANVTENYQFDADSQRVLINATARDVTLTGNITNGGAKNFTMVELEGGDNGSGTGYTAKIDGNVADGAHPVRTVFLDTTADGKTLITGDTTAYHVFISSLGGGSAGTSTFGGNLTGIVHFRADGSVAVAANKSINGDVDNHTGSHGAGTLTFATTTTDTTLVTGEIGGTHHLKEINVNVNTGKTATFGHDVKVLTFNAGGTGTVRFSSGPSSNLTVTKTLNIGETTAIVEDNLDISGAALKVSAIGDGTDFTSHGSITTGSLTAMSGTEKIHVTLTNLVADGKNFKLIDVAGAENAKTLAAGNVTTNSAVISFTAQSGTHAGVLNAAVGAVGQDLYLVASRLAGGYTAAVGATAIPAYAAPAAGSLDALATGGTATGDMLTVVSAFDTMSAAELAAELPRLAPITSTAATSTSFNVVNNVLGTVGDRLLAARGDSQFAGMTGVAAGGGQRASAFWLKGFGSTGKQDMRDGFEGYKANGLGIAGGLDADVNGWRLGVAYAYANTDVDMRDRRSGDSLDVGTHQITAYGTREMGRAYFDGMISYANHDYDSKRRTALNRTATGSFDGSQWTVKVGGGNRMPVAGGTLIPFASIEWSSLRQDSHTETGAGALNLNVASSKSTRLKSGLGLRFTGETTLGGMTAQPEVHAAWYHDFKDRGTDTTARFTGGGASFSTPGQKIARNSYNLGAGLTFLPNKTSKVSVTYDFDTRSGYKGHALQVTGRWDF